MTQTPEMHPDIAQFLAIALPRDGGNHTLAVGEDHSVNDHTVWLTQHLPTLKQTHNLTTIGLEIPAYKNIFLWAYQDGTLERELGSKQAAQQYLVEAMVADVLPDLQQARRTVINLAIAAMDMGIKVVTYDGRVSFNAIKQWCIKNPSQQLTQNPPERSNLVANESHQRQITQENTAYTCNWQLNEMQWLLNLNPHYKPKFDAIENMVQVGHRKIKAGKLTSDALSATMFNALAAPTGNRLTLGGAAHISGIYCDALNPLDTIHGSFHDHVRVVALPAVGQPAGAPQRHKVTHSIIATTADIDTIAQLLWEDSVNTNRPAIENPPLTIINISRGANPPIMKLELDSEYTFPLNEAFLTPLSKRFHTRINNNPSSPRIEVYINARKKRAEAQVAPLLIPAIKAAADAVYAAMNPELGGHGR